MTAGAGPGLSGLRAAGTPVAWTSAGFDAGGGRFAIGTVRLELSGAGDGPALPGWTLAGVDPGARADIDGIPTTFDDEDEHTAPAVHENGATSVDHVVVLTPDLDRTLAALQRAGLEVRRVRDAGSAERPMRQAFLWAGDVILEVAGPAVPDGDGPASLWGLTVVVPDLGATAACLGERLGTARDAVQPGRRIATLRGTAGVPVPLAFITPHVRGA
jgi:hypothetical protein